MCRRKNTIWDIPFFHICLDPWYHFLGNQCHVLSRCLDKQLNYGAFIIGNVWKHPQQTQWHWINVVLGYFGWQRCQLENNVDPTSYLTLFSTISKQPKINVDTTSYLTLFSTTPKQPKINVDSTLKSHPVFNHLKTT